MKPLYRFTIQKSRSDDRERHYLWRLEPTLSGKTLSWLEANGVEVVDVHEDRRPTNPEEWVIYLNQKTGWRP